MTYATRHPALRPQGFKPLLRGDAAQDRRLVGALLDLWEGEGFAQVAPISVDFADSLLQGQSDQARARAFRFMDPSDGAMLALTSDVTQGIARLARGELALTPRPLRLSYEGQAIRAAASATRPARQFGQVGLEVIGLPAEDTGTPKNLICLAVESLKTLGLTRLNLTLVDPPLAQNLIARDMAGLALARAQQRELAQALDRKDEGKIRALAGDHTPRLLDLMLGKADGDPALRELSNLKTQLQTALCNAETTIRIEPFEQRGFAFQSGASFALYAPHIRGELGRGGTYNLDGERCFGFTLYRDTLLAALQQ